MRFIQISLFIILSSVYQVAMSDVYVGVGGGLSEFDYENVDEGSARRAYIGYQFTGQLYGVELAYIDSGEGDIDRLDLELSVEGVNLSFVYNSAVSPGNAQPFNGYFKLGAYSLDTKLSSSIDSIEESSNGFSLGLGADYYLADSFALRADVVMLFGVEDFADDGAITFITLGAQYRF